MGRIIGGVVVGLIGSWIAAVVLVMVLGSVLGADGIRDATSKAPTTTWLAVMLVVTGATAYLGGAIARAIGKDKKAAYIFMGLIAALTIVQIVMAGSGQKPPEQPMPENPPAFVQSMIAMGEAQMNSPKWLLFVSPLITLLGIALGGLNKSDFKNSSGAKPGDWSEPPKPA